MVCCKGCFSSFFAAFCYRSLCCHRRFCLAATRPPYDKTSSGICRKGVLLQGVVFSRRRGGDYVGISSSCARVRVVNVALVSLLVRSFARSLAADTSVSHTICRYLSSADTERHHIRDAICRSHCSLTPAGGARCESYIYRK